MQFIEYLKKAISSEQESRGSQTSNNIRAFFRKIDSHINDCFQLSKDLCAQQESIIEADAQKIKIHIRTPSTTLIMHSIELAYQRYNEIPAPADSDYEALLHSIHQQIQMSLTQFIIGFFDKESNPMGSLILNPEKDLINADILTQENTLYIIFIDTILKLVKTTIAQKIMAETDEDNKTPLAIACYRGDKRLLDSLITHGFSKRTHYKIPFTPLIEIAVTERHQDIIDYLHTLNTKKFNKSILGMVGLMGSLNTSPNARFAVVKQSGSSYTGTLPKETTEILRPIRIEKTEGQEQVATTPAGSKMRSTWHIMVNKDFNPKPVMLFLDEHKVPGKREEPKSAASETPVGLPRNTKNELMIQLTPTLLDMWSKEAENTKRYRDQKQTMGNIAAAQVAKLAGFTIIDTSSWNYCHLIAFSMGGPDGLLPIVESEYDLVGPQRECNLVIGTIEANAMMLIVEDIAKKLIQYKKLEEIWIRVKTTFAPGLEAYHIAEFVEYTIQDCKENPTRQITFNFDMLTRQKITDTEISTLGTLCTDIFINGDDVLLTPQAKRIRYFEPDSLEHDSGLSESSLDEECSFSELTTPHFGPETPFRNYVKPSLIRTREQMEGTLEDECSPVANRKMIRA